MRPSTSTCGVVRAAAAAAGASAGARRATATAARQQQTSGEADGTQRKAEVLQDYASAEPSRIDRRRQRARDASAQLRQSPASGSCAAARQHRHALGVGQHARAAGAPRARPGRARRNRRRSLRIADSGARPLWKSIASSVSASWAKKPSSSACGAGGFVALAPSRPRRGGAPSRQRRQAHFVAQHLHRRGEVERAVVGVGRDVHRGMAQLQLVVVQAGALAAEHQRDLGACRARRPARARRPRAARSSLQRDAAAARGAAEHQRGSRRRPRPGSRRRGAASSTSSAPAASAIGLGVRAPSPAPPAPAATGPWSSSRGPPSRCCRGAGCRPGRCACVTRHGDASGGRRGRGVGTHGRNGKLRGPATEPACSFTPASPSPPPIRGRSAMQKPAVTVMVKAARAAGNVLLRHMNKLDALNVVEKDRHGLRQRSRRPGRGRDHQGTASRATPDYAILGEETGAQRQAAASPWSSTRSTAPATTCAASRISACRSRWSRTASRSTA